MFRLGLDEDKSPLNFPRLIFYYQKKQKKLAKKEHLLLWKIFNYEASKFNL